MELVCSSTRLLRSQRSACEPVNESRMQGLVLADRSDQVEVLDSKIGTLSHETLVTSRELHYLTAERQD